ncbi:hypothetical protein niasHT_006853 [Heterodera trifolii]|uniref:Uncharacterized protein n=1 Tax=Heterodera trifolii TaxID=157864 RepID=A0ABD2M972_9BILA
MGRRRQLDRSCTFSGAPVKGNLNKRANPSSRSIRYTSQPQRSCDSALDSSQFTRRYYGNPRRKIKAGMPVSQALRHSMRRTGAPELRSVKRELEPQVRASTPKPHSRAEQIPISECYLISEDDFHYLLLWFHHCTTENDQLCAKLIKKCISLFSDHFSNFKWANSFICVAINNFSRAGAGQLTVRVRGPKGALNVEMQRDSAQEWTSIGSVIELLEEFTVCKTGDQLSADHARILKQFGHRLAQFRQLVVADQARILKQFGQQLAQFRVRLLARWSKKKGFEQIDEEADE